MSDHIGSKSSAALFPLLIGTKARHVSGVARALNMH
ncbi:hypothetical protein XINFAN_04093 [Pseudogemmobacter humi]|uniref:Uncharacterized protein n=1 Tax=Pseudogemmobacter humi TaxID=2483812 RepID=A0A3P5XSS5_9RHOB|nr:hypothetical protein XINFAN_04093 [Pseudogemmobacter humi]